MKNIIYFFLSLFLFGCDLSSTMHIYSMDKSQCITVIDKWHTRYIIDGKHFDVPKTNFVKLEVGDVDPLADGIYICWKSDDYEWELVANEAIVVDSNLDTSRFSFDTALPLDKRRIPTIAKFRGEGCAVFDYYQRRLIPDQGAIVEFVD